MKLLCALVLKPAIDVLVGGGAFAGGAAPIVDYGSAGAIAQRLRDGEACDAVILQTHLLHALQADGRVAPGSIVPLARSGVAIAVRAGARPPPLDSVDALKRALLAAATIAYPDPARGHASGIHFSAVVERLGIAPAVAAKAVLMEGTLIEFAARGGDAELAVTQPMEILATEGFELAAWLPPDLQNPEKFTWAAAVASASKDAEAAEAFIRFLKSDRAAREIETKGMTPIRG